MSYSEASKKASCIVFLKAMAALYSATTTRPDVAKAMAKQAEFLVNPGPRHIDAIDRVIQYLHQIRFFIIDYGRRSKIKKNHLQRASITQRNPSNSRPMPHS